jgi:hypothetical protein
MVLGGREVSFVKTSRRPSSNTIVLKWLRRVKSLKVPRMIDFRREATPGQFVNKSLPGRSLLNFHCLLRSLLLARILKRNNSIVCAN